MSAAEQGKTLATHLADPKIPAVRVKNGAGEVRHHVWCPWCEEIHSHGNTSGHRVAHCHPWRGSPIGGYDMVVTLEGARPEAIIPKSPFAGSRNFRESINDASEGIQRMVCAAMLGKQWTGLRPGGAFENGKYRYVVGVAPWGHPTPWYIGLRNSHHDLAKGDDLISMAAWLYGIPHGVAAVRIVEAATGACLDQEAALELSQAIDSWHDRGSPQGTGRKL